MEERVVEIDREEVQKRVQAGAQLVEVLSAKNYERVHLAGAASLPLAELDRETAAGLDRSRPVIVYCYDYR